MNEIFDDLLRVLKCPICANGILRADGSQLVCESCGRRYPTKDGIPDLLPQSGVLPAANAPQTLSGAKG